MGARGFRKTSSAFNADASCLHKKSLNIHMNARLVKSLATTSPSKKVAYLAAGKTITVRRYLYFSLAYGRNIRVTTCTVQKSCQEFFWRFLKKPRNL
jgi:hypothetical protein